MPSAWGIHDWDGKTAAPSGCGYYRIIQPLAELGKNGWQTGWRQGNPPPGPHDVIAGQRLDRHDGLGMWRRLSLASALVYDIDDDLWNIRRSNWNAYQTFQAPNRDAVAAYATYAALVTVTTEPLADIMRRHNRNVAVLPNQVPGWLLDHDRPRRDGRVVIGWAGGASHGEDLAMIARPLRAVLADCPDAEVHIIGCDFRATIGADPAQMRYSDWLPIGLDGDYYRMIDFDIALAPLTGTIFDESKSAIKALEAMALGIPVIASACTAYRGVVVDGVTGYAAASRSEWKRRLRELVNDGAARAEMGAKAREAARGHVIDAGWRLWADAYRALL